MSLDLANLVRPIIGIENRTAQEAFDIMADRFRSAAPALLDAYAERDRLREALDAQEPFLRHNGLCALIGGYGYCSCGLDAARAALTSAPASREGEA